MNRIVSAIAIAVVFCLCEPVRGQDEKPVDPATVDMLRVVTDKDGSANVRSGPSIDAKVAGKLVSGAVVSTWETKGEWSRIEDDSGDGKSLFVHSSRLKKLEGWKQFSGTRGSPEKATIKAGPMEVEATAEPFVEKGRKITKDKDGIILKVDGRKPWGTDGTLPQKSLSLAISLDAKPVAVPSAAVNDLFEPMMDSLVLLTPGKPKEHAVIIMWNSDGAGGYLVAWSFVAGRYAGRTIFVP